MNGRRGRTSAWWVVGSVVAALALGAGVWAWTRAGDEDPEALGREAWLATGADQYERADALLRRRERLIPDDPRGLVLRGELERRRGRDQAALAALSRIPDSASEAAQARLLAGQIERAAGRLRPAEAFYLEALRLDPRSVPTRRELIYVYGMQARRAALSAQFEALAELAPINSSEVMIWTASTDDIWVTDSILEDLARFLAADPDDRYSRLAMGQALERAGRVDESEEVIRPLPVDDIDARALRARIALVRSRLDEAAALLAEGPEEHATLALLRGQFALRRQDPAAAEGPLRIACRLDPTSREALQGLGLALKLLGRDDETVKCSERAGKLRELSALLDRARSEAGQKSPDLPRQLAAACEGLGLNSMARGWYRIVVERDPLNAEAQQALFRLSGRSTPQP